MSGRRWALIAAVAAAALTWWAPSEASAHPMPNSVIELTVRDGSVDAIVRLPVDDLSIASGIDLRGDGAAAFDENVPALANYVTAHLRPTTMDGEPWAVTVGTMSISDAEQTASGAYREVVVEAELVPPAGGDVRHFQLGDDLIVHQVVTHVTLVSVREDWANGRLGDDATQVGVVRIDTGSMQVDALEIDLENGSAWRGFFAMVELGHDHILDGTDHLMFLLTLLLPAALIASDRRWVAPAGFSQATARIAGITMAFTLGHSVALAVSALTRVHIDDRPVEVLIAVSILVSAIHALRPMFPGREPWIAALFGVVHGMAFSFTLADLDLSTRQLLISLLGFNLGIELTQMLLVVLALPVLVLLARTPAQGAVRTAGALTTGVAAVAWAVARAGWPNAVARLADRLGGNIRGAVVPLAVLSLGAAAALGLLRYVSRPPGAATPRIDVDSTAREAPVAVGEF